MSNVGNRRWRVFCFGLMFSVVFTSAALLGAFFTSRWQSIIVEDASQPAYFELHARPGDLWPMENVTGLTVIVTGQIDGTAELTIDGEDPAKLSGTVHYKREGDWYDSDCRIHYVPIDVKSGHLKIRSRFRGI